MHLIFSGEEPWLKNNGKFSTILDHLYFSKNEVPYLKVNNFLFSKNLPNVDFRIMLRWCLEFNQLKRVNFDHIESIIQDYLTNNLVRDINFDCFGHNTRLG